MGGSADHFTRDDRQKTISYWYLLMFLLEIYSANRNPFEVKKGETWLSDGLSSMEKLTSDLGDRFKEETVRRYVFDLKSHGLIAIDGRGPAGMVKLSAPALLALTDTIRQWLSAFRDLDRRFSGMGSLLTAAAVNTLVIKDGLHCPDAADQFILEVANGCWSDDRI